MNWKISPAWALSVSYGNSHIVRDRHFNTIDLDTYGPDTNGDGVLSIGLQPGATFDNSNYRAEIAGAAEAVVHEARAAGRCLAEHSRRLHLDDRSRHVSGRHADGAARDVHAERVRSGRYSGNAVPGADGHACAHRRHRLLPVRPHRDDELAAGARGRAQDRLHRDESRHGCRHVRGRADLRFLRRGREAAARG